MIRFSILTSNLDLIEKIKGEGVRVSRRDSFNYMIYGPVCVESRLCELIEKYAEELKASVAVHMYVRDDGTGESSEGWMMIHEGKLL